MEPANGSAGHNGIGNGGYHGGGGGGGGYQGGYDPSLLVEDKWNLSSGPQTNGVAGGAGGQASQNGNGVKRGYNDNDHYLR